MPAAIILNVVETPPYAHQVLGKYDLSKRKSFPISGTELTLRAAGVEFFSRCIILSVPAAGAVFDTQETFQRACHMKSSPGFHS